MKILVTNDDSINAEGIKVLINVARKFGDVVVVAPAKQCSAMSMKLTLGESLEIKYLSEEPATDKLGSLKLYSVGGTPADCVRVGFGYILGERPDYVFSGINHGYNTGFDIAYSGTAAAAMESIMNYVPSIAFSSAMGRNFRCCEEYLPRVIEDILKEKPNTDYFWNVNVPECAPEEIKGIKYRQRIAKQPFFGDCYIEMEGERKNEKGESIPQPHLEKEQQKDPSEKKYDCFGVEIAATIPPTSEGWQDPDYTNTQAVEFRQGSLISYGIGTDLMPGESTRVLAHGVVSSSAPEETDIGTLYDNYISVGKVRPFVLNSVNE